MPGYEYIGPCPVPDSAGVLVHPGDVLEADSEPPWGAWRELPDDPGTPEPPPPPPPSVPAPAEKTPAAPSAAAEPPATGTGGK